MVRAIWDWKAGFRHRDDRRAEAVARMHEALVAKAGKELSMTVTGNGSGNSGGHQAVELVARCDSIGD